MVSPPDEQAREVQTMVGVEVRQQNMNSIGIRMTLKCAEYSAAEIDHQRRGVGRTQKIPRRWRIRPDNTAGATEYGDSHAH
jgi:hypothetical protein